MRPNSVLKNGAPRVYRFPSGHLQFKIAYRGKRFVYAAGLPPIPESQWIPDEQRVKRAAKITHKGKTMSGAEINTEIDRLAEALTDNVMKYGKLDTEALLIDLKLRTAETHFYDEVMEIIKNLDVADSTKVTKRAVWNKIKLFEPHLRWETIDMNFYKRLMQHLDKIQFRQPGKYVKEIKAMCRIGLDHNHPVNMDFTKKSFRAVWRKALPEKDVYLTWKELDVLFELNDEIINGFLIGTYFGLRHSDWHKATPVNEVNKFLNLTQQKVDEHLTLPIHSRVRELWQRDYRFISSQKTNEHLKDKVPGKKISTHTARRTFATLHYKAGTPISVLYRLTGHSSEKQLKTYLKIADKDVATMAMDYKFYQN